MHVIAPEDVVLRDGSVVELRPVERVDEAAVHDLLAGLSAESRAKRFLTGAIDLERAAAREARTGDPAHVAILASAGGRVLAIGSYDVVAPDLAELAFAVADEAQGRGVGTLLLGRLAAEAEAAGIERLEAVVATANSAMIRVFRDSGFPVAIRSDRGVLHVELPSARTDEARKRFEDRDRRAAVAGVERILRPGSVAVVGASPHRGTVAGEVTRNVLTCEFPGEIRLVNPHHQALAGRPVARSIEEAGGDVELAVVVVPAAAVLEVAKACARSGVRALLVLSAGFAETGPEGAARQDELLAICRRAGMRLVGPNCMGVVNCASDAPLAATFAPDLPTPGTVAIATQSGGLGLAAMEHARDLGVGVSSFVSFGNKADVSGNDLLQYWEADPATDAVLLYLESFGRPRSFSRIARRVTRMKPVVAVKAGRTPAGARGAASHTGAIVTASDLTVDALFRQAGVVRVDTADELLEVGAVLATLPTPRGPRVGVVSNAGGLGIMAADACVAEGLTVPELSAGLRARLGDAQAGAATHNPVDLLPVPSQKGIRAVVEALATSGEVDAIIAIHIRPFAGTDPGVPRTLVDLARARPAGLPVLPVLIGGEHPRTTDVPVLHSPERAARALAHAWTYEARRQEPPGALPDISVDADGAAALVAEALERGGGWLEPRHVTALLRCYGLPLAEARVVATPGEAAAAAADLGGAVALKIVAPTVVHKSDVDGVATDLEGASAVAAAARDMAARASERGHEIRGFVVQEMVRGGVELLVGVVHDELFGPVVACSSGGVTAELSRDVAVRLAPVTDRAASEMVRSLVTFPLLDGYRGAPRADVDAVEDVVLRVGLLADAHPEIAELDLNPVIATPQGAFVVDARIRIAEQSLRDLRRR